MRGGLSPGRPTVIDRIDFVDDVPLHLLRRRLLRQFATVGTQDANTRMHVERNGIGSRHVEIELYGWELQRDADQGTCTVENDEEQCIGDGIELFAVSVTRPGAQAIPLLRSAQTAWTLPGKECPDTWLVVGGGRARGRFRPILWNSGLATTQQSELSGLATIRDFETRQLAFAQTMQTIAHRSGAEVAKELQHLLDTIRLTRRHLIPALSLDALKAAARHPAIPVRLLWAADDTTLQDVIELEDELPFLWCLSDIDVLQHIVRDFLHTLRELGLTDEDARDVANAKLTQLGDRCPQIAAACWVAREANGIQHPGKDEAPLSQLLHPAFIGMLRARVGVRRVTDDEWRRSVAETHDWQNFPEDVRVDAPTYAASMIATKSVPNERDVAVLRHLREQDPDEFDYRFRAAFQLTVATLGTLP